MTKLEKDEKFITDPRVVLAILKLKSVKLNKIQKDLIITCKHDSGNLKHTKFKIFNTRLEGTNSNNPNWHTILYF